MCHGSSGKNDLLWGGGVGGFTWRIEAAGPVGEMFLEHLFLEGKRFWGGGSVSFTWDLVQRRAHRERL